jgi:hypothetical protein
MNRKRERRAFTRWRLSNPPVITHRDILGRYTCAVPFWLNHACYLVAGSVA